MPRRRVKKKWDPRPLAEEVTQRVMMELGLEGYGVPREKVFELVLGIVEDIASQMKSRPKPGPVFNRIKRNRDRFLKAVSAMILERIDEAGAGEVELLLSANPELAVRAAPLVYRRINALGANYLIERLRAIWEAGAAGFHLYCPRCGFKSVTPALTCMVCGAGLDEEEVKQYNGFAEKLAATAMRWSKEEVERALRTGYVLWGYEIIPPSSSAGGRSPGMLEVYLSKKDRAILEEILADKS